MLVWSRLPPKGERLWLNLRLPAVPVATDFFAPGGYTGSITWTRRLGLRIYLDVVMGINFLVDFLLLMGTNRLAGFPSDKKRLFLASFLGAVYSGVCLLPGFRFLSNTL